jgi:hypothetical protein
MAGEAAKELGNKFFKDHKFQHVSRFLLPLAFMH